jgi:hypothetical protein
MITRNVLVVFFILALVGIVAAWSKLRFVDEEDHEPQRWRLQEHPAFQKSSGQG